MSGYYPTIPGSMGDSLPSHVIDEILYGKDDKHAECAREIYELEDGKIPDIVRILEKHFPRR